MLRLNLVLFLQNLFPLESVFLSMVHARKKCEELVTFSGNDSKAPYNNYLLHIQRIIVTKKEIWFVVITIYVRRDL